MVLLPKLAEPHVATVGAEARIRRMRGRAVFGVAAGVGALCGTEGQVVLVELCNRQVTPQLVNLAHLLANPHIYLT